MMDLVLLVPAIPRELKSPGKDQASPVAAARSVYAHGCLPPSTSSAQPSIPPRAPGYPPNSPVLPFSAHEDLLAPPALIRQPMWTQLMAFVHLRLIASPTLSLADAFVFARQAPADVSLPARFLFGRCDDNGRPQVRLGCTYSRALH